MEIVRVENQNVFRFEKVEIRKPQTRDYFTAEQITGKREGFAYMLALMAQVCIFDGQRRVMEELMSMEQDDFLELSAAMVGKTKEELLAAAMKTSS